jgi:hypothetical protein
MTVVLFAWNASIEREFRNHRRQTLDGLVPCIRRCRPLCGDGARHRLVCFAVFGSLLRRTAIWARSLHCEETIVVLCAPQGRLALISPIISDASACLPSVLLASEDSQIGVRMRVCLYGQDRTHRSSSCWSPQSRRAGPCRPRRLGLLDALKLSRRWAWNRYRVLSEFTRQPTAPVCREHLSPPAAKLGGGKWPIAFFEQVLPRPLRCLAGCRRLAEREL